MASLRSAVIADVGDGTLLAVHSVRGYVHGHAERFVHGLDAQHRPATAYAHDTARIRMRELELERDWPADSQCLLRREEHPRGTDVTSGAFGIVQDDGQRKREARRYSALRTVPRV